MTFGVVGKHLYSFRGELVVVYDGMNVLVYSGSFLKPLCAIVPFFMMDPAVILIKY